MPSISTCPNVEQLRQFLLGQLPEQDSGELEAHLSSCPACAAAVQSLQADDAFTQAVRSGAAFSGERSASIEAVLDRVRALRQPEPATEPGVASSDTHSPAGEATEENYDFLAPAQAADEIGRLGPYRVLQVLGTGGMGVVFRAEDPQLRRMVALKAMRPELAVRASSGQRFLREAQAAAAIKHDHIVTIYQVGEDRGVPFLAMEFLEGEPLDQRLKREAKLPVAEVLRIGREMAEGLEAAHARGLIHRDIKPANVWLEGTRGRVKILDFGLARATASGDAQLTQPGVIVGTPAYMAPEQAGGHAVDHRCDLFSLGCVLYWLATGQQPFRGKDMMSTLLAVATENPTPPAVLNFDVPAPLSDLIMKLLAKKPDKRPQSAAEVVQALRDIERDATTILPPPERKETLAPAPRRPRRLAAMLTVVLLACLGGGTYLFAPTVIRFATNQGEVVVETEDPKVEVLTGQQGVTIHDKATGRKYALGIGKHDVQAGTYEIDVSEGDSGLRFSVRQFAITRNGQQIIKVWLEPPAVARPKDPVRPPPAVVKLPAGASPLDALRREDIPAYELKVAGAGDPQRAPEELVAVLGESRLRHTTSVFSVSWSPDGKHLASSGYEGWVRLWEAANGQQVAVLRHSTLVPCLTYSLDGKRLATGNKEAVRVWDPATGKELLTLRHGTQVTDVAFSPDGARLASCNGNDKSKQPGEVKVWDAATGKELLTIPTNAQLYGVDFSPDGKRLAATGRIQNGEQAGWWLKLWDTATGKELLTLPMGNYAVAFQPGGVAFQPGGNQLAACNGHNVTVWDAATSKELRTFSLFAVKAVAYSRDGRHLAASGRGTARVWEASSGRLVSALPVRAGFDVMDVAFSPDGQRLATASATGALQVWDVATGKEAIPVAGHAGAGACVAVSSDGRWLASGAGDGTVRVWDAATGKEQRPLQLRVPSGISRVAFSPDGKRLAAGGKTSEEIKVWDPLSGEELLVLKGQGGVNSLAFSPDSKRLASGTGLVATLWDAQTGQELFSLRGHTAAVHGLCFSPDGKTLASGSWDMTVKLWDVATKQEVRTFKDLPGLVHRVAFSPDGKQFLTAGAWSGPKVWDVATGKEVRTFRPVKGFNRVAGYNRDGRTIVGVSDTSRIVVWEEATGEVRHEVALPGVDVGISDLALAPDGRHVIVGNTNGTVYVFRLAPPTRK